MSKVFALVDCNNFFVSCERVFQPGLNGKPVVVLSSNDGCVISRSQEAKDLGIPMGIPYFKWRDLMVKDNVRVFSSNFELYGDLSDRVMQSLQHFTDDIEIYSIDEAFLHFDEQVCTVDFAKEIRETVIQWTKIPISVGIAPTKTLAKVANHIAKKQKQYGGAFKITMDTIDECLSALPVGEVWGIGRASTMFLTRNRVKTALEFKNCSDAWIKKNLTSRGLQIAYELRGQSCFDSDDAPSPKKGIICSRSFGQAVTGLNELKEAVTTFTTKAAEKLRQEKEVAAYLYVYIRTNVHNQDAKYSASEGCQLPLATSFTPELINQAMMLLERIYKKGFRYWKAGVGLSHLIPETQVQHNLFFKSLPSPKKKSLMKTVDALNLRYGDTTVHYAGSGFKRAWQVKKEHISKRFTTSLKELPTAK